MRNAYAIFAVLGLSSGLFAAARADTALHPPLAPTRDATVNYITQMKGKADSQKVTVSFSRNGDRMRSEPNDGSAAIILDRPAQLVTMVVTKPKIYMQFKPAGGLSSPFLLSLAMHFTPEGDDVVAGTPCHKWAIASDKGHGNACVTDDGIILSEDGVDADGQEGKLVAQKIDYAPIDPAIFQPPAGYEQIRGKMPLPHGNHAVGAAVTHP
ncbi:hypothetical protein [Brytella acorum]|uniref:DUF4412 domain-containing protein n=1 Tax=Brytella acorum TaxID=2959299 RepID=A0AA35UNK8_9PROT|nr:hypothetical protein [Brytella acorum]MDF3623826.1 hypothetical protein [Brytella acorum]CAI9120741.1 hypothetical protein LMG32879_001579 [Brytella acorum]